MIRKLSLVVALAVLFSFVGLTAFAEAEGPESQEQVEIILWGIDPMLGWLRQPGDARFDIGSIAAYKG